VQGNNTIVAKRFTVKGLIQGVGFRPFVFRLAAEYNLKGWVNNTNEAVNIHVEGTSEAIHKFELNLEKKKPVHSEIETIKSSDVEIEHYEYFSIIQSTDVSKNFTEVSPDIAVCEDCLDDMLQPSDRFHYPLINCMHCGPRFSIVKELPYDRCNTTMAPFTMCENCRKEYEDPSDRRFHAQPIACNHCGPLYSLYKKNDETVVADSAENLQTIINQLQQGLGRGEIYAFKATGGYNLVCNALDEKAVARLRAVKHRDTKPFAVMFSSISTLKGYLYCNHHEEQCLTSFRRPIVILKNKKELAHSVSKGFPTTGAMLPYMPLHYLIFQHTNLEALVMTSANISEEPIVIDDEKALNAFLPLVDGVLTYNRDIHNRIDDSVLFVANDIPRLIRRSKGYVPQSIDVVDNVEGIVAVGAELTGAFALGKGDKAILSQHLGDLQDFENFQFFVESFERFKHLFRFNADMVVCDMHPDYVTTGFAKSLNVKVVEVQHHHAHIASVLSEHKCTEPVLGIAFDGTGYGLDGKIWGSEFLYCHKSEMERLAHFEYVSLPGGDMATLEPWRVAVSYLYAAYGKDFKSLPLEMFKSIDAVKLNTVVTSIDKQINSPQSCSAGRLFDAVSALTGICILPSFHAEAPMRLEAAIVSDEKFYTPRVNGDEISFLPVIRQIVEELLSGTDKGIIAARFHNTIINVVVEMAEKIRQKKEINIVAFSGGVFQNKYLLENSENKLSERGFKVLTNINVPCNDVSVALGQLYLGLLYKNLKTTSTPSL